MKIFKYMALALAAVVTMGCVVEYLIYEVYDEFHILLHETT